MHLTTSAGVHADDEAVVDDEVVIVVVKMATVLITKIIYYHYFFINKSFRNYKVWRIPHNQIKSLIDFVF